MSVNFHLQVQLNQQYKHPISIISIQLQVNMTARQTTEHMSSSNSKFAAFKLKKNEINPGKLKEDDEDYQFEEMLMSHNKTANIKKQKQNISNQPTKPYSKPSKTCLEKQSQFQAKSFMNQLNYPSHMSLKKQGQKTCKYLQSQCKILSAQDNDLTELWNLLDKQESLKMQRNHKVTSQFESKQGQKWEQQNTKNEREEYYKTKTLINDTQSSCEMTEQELKQWMECCEYQNQHIIQPHDQQVEISRSGNRNKCIYLADQTNYQPADTKQKQDWDSWTKIIQQFQRVGQQIQKQQNKNNGPKIKPSLLEIQKYTQAEDFVIIDTPLQFIKTSEPQALPDVFPFCQVVEANSNKNLPEQQQYCKYGPWKYNLEHYQLYSKYNIVLMQQLKIDLNMSKKINQKQAHMIHEAARPIRKINWQILQQEKPEIKALRSKRNCKSTLLIYGKDFFVFEHAKFAISPIRQGTHMYFGIRAFGDFVQYDGSGNSLKQLASVKSYKGNSIKQYLYIPSSGQCLLETVYPQKVDPQKISKFHIAMSLNQEKVAVCQRLYSNDMKDRKQIIQVKLYDTFEKSATQYLGVVQSKISKFSEQWYCDTIIYIPKRKLYSRKINDRDWDMFKIQLRLSELGTIVAELGIFQAKSSVTNCILFNQNKISQFMMATIQQSKQQVNYILRLAGLSPVMGFVTTLSRKIFVNSASM